MVHLCRDPEGENVMDPSSTGGTNLTDAMDKADEIANLKQQLSELQTKLAEVTTVNHS